MSTEYPIPRELFQTLLAIGWIDGALVDAERDAILEAARNVGLSQGDVDALRRQAASPVTFVDMDFDHLDRAQRLLIYGVASWVAQADDQVTGDERAALHAIATLLGLTGRGRTVMDETVDALRRDPNAPGRLDLAALRDRIAGRIPEAARS
jgi:tellurite resistance protein